MIALLTLYLTTVPLLEDPALAAPLAFPAGTDLCGVAAGYAEGTGQLLARSTRDALRAQRLTEDLELASHDELSELCHAAGLALWPEVHGPWSVLRAAPLTRLRLADCAYVAAEELAGAALDAAAPVATVLTLTTLDRAARARTFEATERLHVLRPGGGQPRWNGLLLWGAAADVTAAALTFDGVAPGAAPNTPRLEPTGARPSFGREDERFLAPRDDEALARMLRLDARGGFLVQGEPRTIEELLRAYELATWFPITYQGGIAQRARGIPAPALPRARLTQQELDHWIQAVLAASDLVAQPAGRAGFLLRGVDRYSAVHDPTLPEQAVGTPTVAHGHLVPGAEPGALLELLDLDGVAWCTDDTRTWIQGPARRIANLTPLVGRCLEQSGRGPAILVVPVLGDAAALAREAMTRLHPNRDLAELCRLPWFGQPLVGAAGDEVLVLADRSRVHLIRDEVRALELGRR